MDTADLDILNQHLPDDSVDEQRALRWRKAILRLTDAFRQASERREDLSPHLLAALHNAMEQLLLFGDEGDLLALEDWLCEEEVRG